MALDAGIYSLNQPVQLANPLAQLAQAYQVQGLAAQSQQAQRALQQEEALNGAYSSALGADGRLDRNALLTNVAGAGLGSRIPKIQQGFSEQDKSAREAEKAELESVIQKFDIGSRIMSGYDPANPQTWQGVIQQTSQYLGADAAARLPQQPPTAEQIQQNMNRAMSAKDLAEQKYKALTLETQRRGQDITMRGQDLTAQTSRANNRDTVDATLRGQNMRSADNAATLNNKTAPKPLPSAALKMQQESLDAIGTASSINADLSGIEKQIDEGKLSFGPVSNLASRVKNATGFSDESSRNLASFQNTLEKLRNDSLRLNKGVQTDGDAQRAWNELFTNINDTQLVKQRLGEIKRLNDRAVQLRKLDIDGVRANYNQEPLDTSSYSRQPNAVGSSPASASGGMAAPKSKADFDALPSGTLFTAPDGTTRRKP